MVSEKKALGHSSGTFKTEDRTNFQCRGKPADPQIYLEATLHQKL
jgi:hypothetical protein